MKNSTEEILEKPWLVEPSRCVDACPRPYLNFVHHLLQQVVAYERSRRIKKFCYRHLLASSSRSWLSLKDCR
jgi:hypothetical protein